MRPRLSAFITITDVIFLLYWSMSALAVANIISIPSEWMYSEYNQPRVVAWNWSFLPIDVAFSVSGLSAFAASRKGSSLWRPLALISLTLTFAAGGLAIGYWTILGEFEPGWFLPNLALVIWPLFFLPGLMKEMVAENIQSSAANAD
jgi:Family of unknown function (DUF5360)